MEDWQITKALAEKIPLSFQQSVNLKQPVGLVIVDEVNGFCTPGAGALAPPVADPNIDAMINITCGVANQFNTRSWPMLVFRDEHDPGQVEPLYPLHCERGTGEELLVPKLAWLNQSKNATIMPKNCINGFVGGIQADGQNIVVNWVNRNQLRMIVIVGICTDICVMDFVLTMLSARNHGMMPTLKDVIVYSPGCSTYNLPTHPANIISYMGLYFMASRGAILTSNLSYWNAEEKMA